MVTLYALFKSQCSITTTAATHDDDDEAELLIVMTPLKC